MHLESQLEREPKTHCPCPWGYNHCHQSNKDLLKRFEKCNCFWFGFGWWKEQWCLIYFKLCFIIVGYSRLNGCLLPVIPGNQWIRSLEKPTGPTIWAVEFKGTIEVSDDHSLLMWSLDLLGEYTLFLTILTMVDFSGDIIQHHPKKTWIDVQQGASSMGVEDKLGRWDPCGTYWNRSEIKNIGVTLW